MSEHLIINRRSCMLYVALYLVSLTVCFILGYFLGVHRSVKLWIQQQEQTVLEQTSEGYLQKNNAAQEDIKEVHVQEPIPNEPNKHYKALLLGGTKQLVDSFVEAMKRKSIVLSVEEKLSKTKKGREYRWYQATTPSFESRQKLEDLVAVLKKHGKLKDVQIVQCS